MSTQEKALILQALHKAPEILQLVNVWDAITAKVIAALPETRAIATAGHSIAASHGYPDGGMPLDLSLQGARTIAEAVDVPVTADLDDGYDDPGETIRAAISFGIVGANVEDRMRPFEEAVARVRAVVRAAESEGIAFQLNARTDTFVRGEGLSSDERIEETIRRGRAYLDEGAALVFVPKATSRPDIERLVEGLGAGKLSILGFPGALTAPEYEALGVARITYGPLTQRVALRALRDLGASLYAGGVIPEDTPALN